MFSFKRKDKDKKEKKKGSKHSKEMSQEELTRLEDIKKGLFPGKKSSSRHKSSAPGHLPLKSQAYSVADDQSNGQYHVDISLSGTERSVDAPLTSPSGSDASSASTPGYEKGSIGDVRNPTTSATLENIVEESRPAREPSHEKKRKSSKGKGILKMKPSTHAPEPDIVVKVNDLELLAKNTAFNQDVGDIVDSHVGFQLSSRETEQPGEKTFDVDLHLPAVAPPKPPRARDVILSRQPNGGFGFTLRRTNIEERSGPNGAISRRQVHFAEPSSTQRDNATGLLPGDRLVEVNGINIESSPRDSIIDMIRGSGDSVTLKVQPIPELIELSMRSGVDGSEVHLEEQLLKTGTLARSASLRIKDRKAKSDAQLAQERAWLEAERVWLVHRGGFSAAKRLATRTPNGVAAGEDTNQLSGDAKVKVKLEQGEEVLDVEEEDVEKANPPQFDRAEDLGSLQFLNESSVLHTLRQRYGANLIHTYAGRNLVVINPTHQLSVYSDKVIQMFRGCKLEDMPPHIYAAAQTAYRSMQTTRQDQSIVFMGRSGGGKSWNIRHVLQYLTIVAGTQSNVVTVDKITAVTTLLDAFGGARTIQNTSATRCANIYSLDFDNQGQIASSSLQILLLEKYRIVRKPEGERAFNILYYLLAGADSSLSQELQLNRKAEKNPYIQPLQRPEELEHGKVMWQKVLGACELLHFTPDECKALWCTLAAIIHLCAAGATKGSGSNRAQFLHPSEAQKAASLLGTSVEDLARHTFSPRAQGTPTRSALRATPSSDSDGVGGMGLPGVGGGGVIDALEGMISGLYTEMVNAMVSLVNRGMSSTHRTKASILVVDMPGLQIPDGCGRKTGASFQDLCHNYTQERLQLLFHDVTLTAQKDKYAQENIQCDLDLDSDSESSPALMVNLIDKQQGLIRTSNPDLRNSDQKGILWLLDEESIFPGASDDSFLERLYLHYHDEANRSDGALKRSRQAKSFVLSHIHGTVPVTYNATNWLRECRENPSVRSASVVLQESQKPNISKLFVSLSGSLPSSMVGSVAGIEGSSSLRRASSMRRAWTSGTAAIKRKSLCMQVKYQVDGIIDSIRRTQLHFVHCLLPHPDAGLCEARMIAGKPPTSSPTSELVDVPLLRSQVRGSHIMAAIRIYRFGFPESMLFQEFRHRFEILAPPEAKTPEPVLDERKAVEELLKHLDLDPSTLRVGLSQIFFRPGALVQLEDKRDRQLSETIVRFQAHCRGYLARHNLKQIKIQKLAITCIQRNVRKFLAVRNWPWWRLVTKVLPLLDVHRTEEELKMKDMELETLRAKVAKLETERNMLKQNVDKLDSRVTEMAADLTEEHTAATHASEMLEVETSERLRLDKECKELRSNYNALQRKSEKMEMEVMEHRMVRSSIIEADMSSDEEADSVFRLKYMQLRKEMELGKKRLQQEHEEELEQVASSRKSIERKLLESLEEGEEYKRQVTSYKRKSQKLVEESHDMKLHLETQQTRNSDLEKKQRKFDAELAKIHQDLHLEKTARERIQREHEKLQGENFLISQQLEDMKSEVKIKEDKIEILRSEMDDLSSHDTMEVKEVTALKRAKRDLESKLQDQEEELDDQAGQIQQLEQTKLRLEMQLERIKQSHQKELDTKDEEVEEVRASAQNKVKQMEIQLEEDYNERQSIQREKRDLERRVQELMDKPLASDRDTEKRLRRDLKKTKALLKDAQTMLERQNSAAPSGAKLKQLKNELEDATFATSSAVKARQNLETELAELQAQLDDMMKAKSDAEEKLSYSNREKTELESKLEDQEEDFNDLLKKHRALIHQMSNEQAKIHTHLETISELSNEKHELEEKVSELQGKIDFLSESMVDKSTVSRLEAKVRDVEARLDLEQTTKNKLENQVERLRDSLDRSSSDHSSVQQKELRSQEASRKLQRELRELRDEYSEAQRKEAESSQKKHEMELEVESLQAANDQIQSDLKLAFKRIADLQSALEDGIGSDSDSLTGGSGSDDSDSDSEADYKPRYSHYSSNRSSLLSSASSMDSAKYGRRARVYSSTSEKSGDEVRRRSRSGKYVINPGSSDEDLDAVEARSTSRPSSLYSEDTVGSTDLADTHTSVSLTSTSTLGGGGGEIGVEVSGSKKKGFVINPDYM